MSTKSAALSVLPSSSEIYEIKTLAELGHQLPIGLGGQREIVFREWSTQEELQMSESIGPRHKEGRYVDVLMATMCQRFGNLEIWSDTGEDAKRLIPLEDAILKLHEAFLADVLYAFFLLRRDVFGRTAYFNISDPFQENKPIRYPINLDTLEVRCPKKQAELQWQYNFDKPIKIGGKTVTYMVMGPPRWGATSLERKCDEIDSVASAIHTIPEYDARFVDAATTEFVAKIRISKPDSVKLYRGVNDDAFGPITTAEYRSPKRPDVVIPFDLDIRHQHFFGASSL